MPVSQSDPVCGNPLSDVSVNPLPDVSVNPSQWWMWMAWRYDKVPGLSAVGCIRISYSFYLLDRLQFLDMESGQVGRWAISSGVVSIPVSWEAWIVRKCSRRTRHLSGAYCHDWGVRVIVQNEGTMGCGKWESRYYGESWREVEMTWEYSVVVVCICHIFKKWSEVLQSGSMWCRCAAKHLVDTVWNDE